MKFVLCLAVVAFMAMSCSAVSSGGMCWADWHQYYPSFAARLGVGKRGIESDYSTVYYYDTSSYWRHQSWWQEMMAQLSLFNRGVDKRGIESDYSTVYYYDTSSYWRHQSWWQ